MSGLNIITTQDSITAYVRQEFSGYEVYEVDVVNDDAIIKKDGLAKPYIVLRYGGLRNSGNLGSFVGARNDEYYSTVDVIIVSQNSKQARISLNVVIDRLVGWKPVDSTPMYIDGNMDIWGSPVNNGAPPVYMASSRLSYNVNTTDIGSQIQP